jgi:hypothetical protein
LKLSHNIPKEVGLFREGNIKMASHTPAVVMDKYVSLDPHKATSLWRFHIEALYFGNTDI